jgi:uncharacterized DUF497 family protein
MEFEWDARKAAANRRKHGIDFTEATTTFEDPLSVTISDPDHSFDEQRLLLLGVSSQHRLLVVAHCERVEVIRIISARHATRYERRIYEEESTPIH